MRCDVCKQRIDINRQAWVYEEIPTEIAGTTIITYAAHQHCHALSQNQPQASAWSLFWNAR